MVVVVGAIVVVVVVGAIVVVVVVGATVVVVVVGATVVLVGVIGVGVHAANNAIHAATTTTRSEPCLCIGVSPTLRWQNSATRKE